MFPRPFCVFSRRIFLQNDEEVKALGDEVIAFAQKWPMPGFEASELKFKEMNH